jgi:hypothetical protein
MSRYYTFIDEMRDFYKIVVMKVMMIMIMRMMMMMIPDRLSAGTILSLVEGCNNH